MSIKKLFLLTPFMLVSLITKSTPADNFRFADDTLLSLMEEQNVQSIYGRLASMKQHDVVHYNELRNQLAQWQQKCGCVPEAQSVADAFARVDRQFAKPVVLALLAHGGKNDLAQYYPADSK